MKRESYLDEIRRQYHLVCVGLKSGKTISASEKGRLEGFMQAGLLLGAVTRDELEDLLEETHFKVFGMPIGERLKDPKMRFPEDEIDYGRFDSPAIERISKKSN
jgi:hypothetical protein